MTHPVRGQSLLVQVIEDPSAGASATQISIAGRMLVYLQEKRVGDSQRIEDEEEREQLRERLTRLVHSKGRCIVRTMAENASDEDLSKDIDYLRKTWRGVEHPCGVARRPSCTGTVLVQRVLRDFVDPGNGEDRNTFPGKLQKTAAIHLLYTPAVLELLVH